MREESLIDECTDDAEDAVVDGKMRDMGDDVDLCMVVLAADNFEDLAVVYKFNSTGTLQWARQLNTENDYAYGDSVVTIGTDIYVVHESDEGNSYVSKLDSTGAVKWQRGTLLY